LEIALYENESADAPRVREGVDLVWQSHKNDMGSKEYEWASIPPHIMNCSYREGDLANNLNSWAVKFLQESMTY
jgi:hypothetical protein